MSKTLNSNKFGDILYNSLPEVYRTEDEKANFALKRYLQSLSEGGFAKVIEETNNLLTLVDSEKIDTKLLPILFKSYGFEIFNGVPEMYLRKLLPMVSELFSMKGSITSVEFLTSIISGVKSTIDVSESFNEDHAVDVILEMDYGAEQSEMPDRQQLLRIIREFVPFFCNVTIVFSYFFSEEFKTYVQEAYFLDTVQTSNEDSISDVEFEEELIQKFITSYADSKSGIEFRDYNSLTGTKDALLNSTFILNNVSSYDIIKKNGKETSLFT